MAPRSHGELIARRLDVPGATEESCESRTLQRRPPSGGWAASVGVAMEGSHGSVQYEQVSSQNRKMKVLFVFIISIATSQGIESSRNKMLLLRTIIVQVVLIPHFAYQEAPATLVWLRCASKDNG